MEKENQIRLHNVKNKKLNILNVFCNPTTIVAFKKSILSLFLNSYILTNSPPTFTPGVIAATIFPTAFTISISKKETVLLTHNAMEAH